MIFQDYVPINGQKVRVLCCGKWIDQLALENSPQDVVVIIPGNPGVAEFYADFAEVLNKELGYTVYVVSHSGHEIPPEGVILDSNYKKSCSFNSQIKPKVAFIEKYIPTNARIHLIGHSIGGYVCQEILKSHIKDRIHHCYLLFPTIENMAETHNGKFITRLKPIVWLIAFLAGIFAILPRAVQVFLIMIFTSITGMINSDHAYNATINLIHPNVLKNVFRMAYQELEIVRARDDQFIRDNIKKLTFLYGDKDGWAPLSYSEVVKDSFPELRCFITSFDHAFVLKQSEIVGNRVVELINES